MPVCSSSPRRCGPVSEELAHADRALLRSITRLAPSSPEAIDKVRQLTEVLRQVPQIPFVTEHMLHAGMYTRTVRLPRNTVCAAVLIKLPTVLIIHGDCEVWSNDELIGTSGYSVLPGSAGRKIAFVTRSDVAMSMIFPTDAKTVDEAQRAFTDEHDLLVPLDRADAHEVLITGE
jgi:hypothetical protein